MFRNIHVVKINEELKKWSTESPIIKKVDEEVNNPMLQVSPQDKESILNTNNNDESLTVDKMTHFVGEVNNPILKISPQNNY